MVTQKDIKNLTKEQALQLHRKMWLAMAKDPKVTKDGIDEDVYFYVIQECVARGRFKRIYMSESNLEVLNDCFLCEYASQQLKNNEEDYCKYCPVEWCKEECCKKDKSYQCECNGECNSLNWRYSNIIDIANIKLKGEKQNGI